MALSPAVATRSPWLAGTIVAAAFLIAVYRWIRYRLARTRRRDDPKFDALWPLLSSLVILAPMLATFGALQFLFGTLYVGFSAMLGTGAVVGVLSCAAFSGMVARVYGEAEPRARLLATHRRNESRRA